jgi:predicted site-specific integrase-resolvase
MPSTNGHGPKRAILYARVFTDEQARSGYSLAQQIEALREYAAREGCVVLEEVVDPGQSGASLERPGRYGPRPGPRGRWWSLRGPGTG